MVVAALVSLFFSSTAQAQSECESQCKPGKVIRVILPADEAWQVVPRENNSVEIRVYTAKGKTEYRFKRLALGRVTVEKGTTNNCALASETQNNRKQFHRLSLVAAVKYFLMDAEWPSRDYEVFWYEGTDPFVQLINWSVGDDLLYPAKEWRLQGCFPEESFPPLPPEISPPVKESEVKQKCDCSRWQKQLRNKYFHLKGGVDDVLRSMLQDGFRFEFVSEGGMLLTE